MPTVYITDRNLHLSTNSILRLTALQFPLFIIVLYAITFGFNWNILNPIQIAFSSLISLKTETCHGPIDCSMQLGSELLKKHHVFVGIFMCIVS